MHNWEKSGKTYRYKDQYSIFYKDEGNGPVLLLLHGFPTSSWDWVKMWPELTKHFRVIALDFIGFGFSDKPNNYNYSLFDQADLVEALLLSLSIKETYILAHDYGDTVLQELLARQNEGTISFAFTKSMLLNGGIFMETTRPRFIQKALLSPFGFMIVPFINKSTLRRNFNAIFGPKTQPSEAEIDGFYEIMIRNKGKKKYPKLIQYIKERHDNRERWVGALQNAKTLIRLVVGGFDPISGQNIANRYIELIPNPDVYILKNIGHYPQVEVPEKILNQALYFFKNCGPLTVMKKW